MRETLYISRLICRWPQIGPQIRPRNLPIRRPLDVGSAQRGWLSVPTFPLVQSLPGYAYLLGQHARRMRFDICDEFVHALNVMDIKNICNGC